MIINTDTGKFESNAFGVLQSLSNRLVKILNNKIRIPMARTKLKWTIDYSMSDRKYHIEDNSVDIHFSCRVMTNYLSGVMEYVTNVKNGEFRFNLDYNPACSMFKNSLENSLDTEIFNSGVQDILENEGLRYLLNTKISFDKPDQLLSNYLNIDLVWTLIQE